MSTNNLVDRFDAEQRELIKELQDLILRTNSLTKEEEGLLEDFRRSFVWDVRFSVDCDFRPYSTSTSGTYYPETLHEFLSLEVGESPDGVDYYCLDDICLDDFEDGEVTVEEKELCVYNFRLRD